MLTLFVFLEADLALTAVIVGLALRKRHRTATVLATALVAFGSVAAVFAAWLLWFVAPYCVGDLAPASCIGGRMGGQSISNGILAALAQWLWMLGVALGARFVAERDLAHVSS